MLDDLRLDERALVDELIAAQLLVVDKIATEGNPECTIVAEVAHVSVLQYWKRLAQWVEENREFLLWRRHLRAAIEQWMGSDQDAGALLQGRPCATAMEWLTRCSGRYLTMQTLSVGIATSQCRIFFG